MKTLNKLLIGLLVIVVAALALVVTCPDEQSFNSWAKSHLKPESGSVAEKAKGAALSTEARFTAEYESHVLWATVEAYQGTTKQRFLGIAGAWFRLSDD